MEKLYAGIFGVFMTTPEDEFEEFIDVVHAVLTDTATTKFKSRYISSWSYYLIVLIVIMLIIFIAILYSKLILKS